MKKKKITKIKTRRIVFAAFYFLLFYMVLTTYYKSYGEFVSTLEPVSSGIANNTVYINDLDADYNYFKGLNYTEIRDENIPSGSSRGYYDDEYLVKVRIIYDGKDINNSSLVGAVSPINNETSNKYIYYKYFALERNTNGTLATNSDGDNYIKVELIDNPFSKRPYNNGIEYGFNGWVCNQGEDTTNGVCENTTMYFNKTNYTRYMEIACDGEDEFTIHLNASWYEADVATTTTDASNFNSMSMQPLLHSVTVNETRQAFAYWKQNYNTFVFSRTYVRGDDQNGYMPAGTWYQTDQNNNGNSYAYNYYRTRCGNRRTCYVYTASSVTSGSQYTGETIRVITGNFYTTGSNNAVVVDSPNNTYMNIVEDPNGPHSIQVPVTYYSFDLNVGNKASGFFYQVSNPTSTMVATREYYNSDGSLCTNANNCRTAYKLINYNDSVNKSNGNTIYQIEESNGNIVDQNLYYYLVTRDTNIFRYTSSSNNGLNMSSLQINRPFTVTGVAVNGTTVAGILNLYNSNLTVANDLAIENIRIYGPNSAGTSNTELGDNTRTSYTIYANSHNLKIGRNTYSSRNSNYLTAYTIMGGTNNAGASGTFRVIVESGYYYAYHSGAMSGSSNYTLNETTLFGSDYDRVTSANNKLRFIIGLDGYAGGHNTAGSDSLFASFNTIKSGTFGYNSDGSANTDNTAGLYIGGRASTCVNSITGAKIEGGQINTVVGGYGYNGTNTTNSSYIGMSGGAVRSIYGGAGHSTTKGNRIINVTGGTIQFGVLGGSDSNSTTDTSDGVVQGSTLVYVGGTVIVGDGTNNTLYGVESGSVYGAGGGRSGYDQKGTVYNSHVIINGGTIRRSVYGGGNYGSTGTQYAGTSSTVIDILDGNIAEVYGGSKSAGFSQNSYRGSSSIEINMSSGTIGNIYGGSNTEGDVYGSVDIDITGGTITGNVYGGGKGAPTFVSNNIDITVGTQGVSGTPIIQGNVYGGSALGIVNSNSSNGTTYGNTNLTINNGNLSGAVFGGGEGNNSNTPYVLGNVNVVVNGGNAANIYGGNDQKGTPKGTITVRINGGTSTNVYGGGNLAPTNTSTVYLSGGNSTNVFGGGNAANATTTNVLLQGSTVSNIYGGSNQSGTVNSATITTTSGTVGTIYGGNNLGGTTTTSHITVNGGNITTIYGGGNEATTGTTNVNLNQSTIQNVYGGGNKAGITNSTNVSLNGSNVTNLYGGSNQSGTVASSNITTTTGTATTIYGGNNLGGSTTTSHIIANGGTLSNIFGGGNEAETGNTTVDVNGGTLTNVYGGGNEAETGTTTINLNGGSSTNVYGGGNKAGITTSTTTTLNGSTIGTIYGGSNQSGSVPSSTINTTNGSVTTIYGGNNLGGSTTSTQINVNGANINTIYGGGNEAETGTTNLVINSWAIDNVYGGGNLATVDTSSVTLQSGYIANVYGGGNQAGITTSTLVNLNGATTGNIYGGSNQSGTVAQSTINATNGNAQTIYGGNNLGGSTTITNINVTGGNITDVFGGGNAADSGTTNVSLSGATLSNVYGGGNQASVTDANVNVGGNIRITNLFGGSNVLGTVTESNISIPFSGTAPTITNIYGGNNQGGQTTSANIDIHCGTIDFIYGGGNYARTGSTNTSVTGATVNRSIFGGGNQAAVDNNVILNLTNTRVLENVYGGGNLGTIGGNTSVSVLNSTLGKSLFAGGNGYTAAVYGNTLLNVGGTTSVVKHVFGGGNAAPTGTEEDNDSTSVVNIAGLTCGGNVYGGANTSVLYGTVTVNIGQEAVTNTITSGNIHIGGTVFGGGEANEQGSEIYDFSFISVTEGITININAQNHNSFEIDGSIFGSGNASSTSGFSSVNINNYGSGSNYKKNVSIQRASLVVLDNSSIELQGATDRTNEYSDVLFSLSRLDEIKLLNNSTLYLETGTNLVKKFTSGLTSNGHERKATVTIDSDGSYTRNVDNKLYIYEGKNINIATNENITAYGEVSGMTFFGMYSHDRDGKVFTALYNTSYDKDSTVPSSEIVYFTKGSYVLGLHHTNHNYEQDGFYSNFAREDTIDKIDVKYIVPTPEDSNYYIWAIGEQVTAYEITLTASKYSTLGTYELPLINFSEANTNFSVLGFNYSELDSEVDLVEKSDIARVASSGTVADHKMSLVMKSSDNGWITIGKTTFLSNESYFSGTTNYIGENSNVVPTFMFYLYHSKNLETSGDMGTVTISLVAITAKNDLENEIKRININVNLNRAIYTTNDYEGTITQGKVYEMFAPSTVNITSTSAFTTYYSLFVESNDSIYRNGYHRVLASTYNFPENTKITMIDLLSGATPEYYYYVVTNNDYQSNINNDDITYDLSKFVRMGSSNANNHYDDVVKNSLYYNSSTHYAEEEFIFIVDFKESGIDEDVINKSLLLELRSSDNEIILSVIGVEQQQLFYNLYANKDSIINVDANMSSNDVYIGEKVNVNVYTNFVQQSIASNPIIDTNFYDYKSGIKLSILDSENNVVNGSSLMGLSYTIGNNIYYPRFDGTTRINIAERIANVSTRIVINTEGSNLASGNYKLLIESFASPDGIYYGLTSSDRVELPFVVKNTIYGLMVIANDNELVIDKTTGLNQNDNNTITFNINYSSGLLNPNLRISLYRRDYSEVYSNTYNLVDLEDYFSDQFTETNLENVYMLFDPPTSTMTSIVHLKDNLTSGTYKVVFGLYDNNTFIGDVCKYIVIK